MAEEPMNHALSVLADECNFCIFADILYRHRKYIAAMEWI
jgi:hypothetical protein